MEAIELVCRACTRTISLDGPIREALATAEGFGWKPDGERVVCPKCKGGKPQPPLGVFDTYRACEPSADSMMRHIMLRSKLTPEGMRGVSDSALRDGFAEPGDVLEVKLHGVSLGKVTA